MLSVISGVVRIHGKRSGDHECWCWDVERETWIEVEGSAEFIDDNKSLFNEGCYRLYPDSIFRYANGRPVQLVEEGQS